MTIDNREWSDVDFAMAIQDAGGDAGALVTLANTWQVAGKLTAARVQAILDKGGNAQVFVQAIQKLQSGKQVTAAMVAYLNAKAMPRD